MLARMVESEKRREDDEQRQKQQAESRARNRERLETALNLLRDFREKWRALGGLGMDAERMTDWLDRTERELALVIEDVREHGAQVGYDTL